MTLDVQVIRKRRGRSLVRALFCIGALLLAAPTLALAGPPYLTDDPETVEYLHWEVYLASQYSHSASGTAGTAPHLEVNYGVRQNVQLHLVMPFTYNHPMGLLRQYGLGDTELGVKYRFMQETATRPQIGIFPLLELPTGDSGRGIGNGQAQMFLPVWIQKSWGRWSSYGGGGYWVNPGTGNQNYWFAGWQVQRSLTKQLSLGTEIFFASPSVVGGSSRTGFNVGLVYDFNEGHHLLFSTGSSIHGDHNDATYLAYQWTFGAREAAKE